MYSSAQQRFRFWQGVGLAASLVVLGGVLLVSAVLA
jgi:hypothetical protein